jgi:hypothetical protein
MDSDSKPPINPDQDAVFIPFLSAKINMLIFASPKKPVPEFKFVQF